MKTHALIAIFFSFLTVVPSFAAPVVFRVSDPVGPGETALLFGGGLAGRVTAVGERLPDTAVGLPQSERRLPTLLGASSLAVLQSSDLSAKVVMPSGEAGIYAVKLHSDSGETSPVLLNRPEAWWWLGGAGDAVAPGGQLRVFGKNLGAKTRGWVKIGSGYVALPVVDAGRYAVTMQIPAAVAPGKYPLVLHNGHGGEYGFSDPLAVTVAPSDAWPTTVYDVRAFGAKGDGVTDDTQAFTDALAKAASNGGGVVTVSRGIYRITGKLVVPPKTTVRGAGRDLVWLMVPKDAPPIDAVFAGNRDFAVEDLSIVSQTAKRLIACPDDPEVYRDARGRAPSPGTVTGNVHLRRLRLQHLHFAHRLQADPPDPRREENAGPTTIYLNGPDMELSDCEVISSGMPIEMLNAHHDVISGNRLCDGRGGWYEIENADECVFTGNTIQAIDLEGTYGGVQGKAYRLYFADNDWKEAYGDEREALTFDTPYFPVWVGHATAVNGTAMALETPNGIPSQLTGLICLIAAGTGMGQWQPIATRTLEGITVPHSWAIPPDATSTVVIRVNKSECVITNNAFSDASVAVQFYAQSLAMIVDGNKSVRTGGFYGTTWDSEDARRGMRRYSTCWFDQWLNNDLEDSISYQQGAFLKGIIGPCAAGSTLDPPVVTTLGNIVRDNRVRNNGTVGAFYFAPRPKTVPKSALGYFGRDTIIEGNAVSDTDVGIEVYPLYRDTLIRHNTLERCDVPLNDSGVGTWSDVPTPKK